MTGQGVRGVRRPIISMCHFRAGESAPNGSRGVRRPAPALAQGLIGCSVFCLVLLSFSPGSPAAAQTPSSPDSGGSSGTAPGVTDLLPPVIVPLAPLPGSRVAETKPLIRVELRDGGSGINPDTLSLVLDDIEVSGQTVFTPPYLEFRPAFDLAGGEHRVRVQVADWAGNVAQFSWAFTVLPPAAPPEGPLREQFRLDLVNRLSVDVLPLLRIGDTLTLNLTGSVGPWRVQARAEGEVNSGWSDWYRVVPPSEWSRSLKSYSLSLKGPGGGLLLGSISVPIGSALLLPPSSPGGAYFYWNPWVSHGKERSGQPATGRSSELDGSLLGFTGEAISSYGFSLRVVSFQGAALLIDLPGGPELSAAAIYTRDRSGEQSSYLASAYGSSARGFEWGVELVTTRSGESAEAEKGTAWALMASGRTANGNWAIEWERSNAGFRSPFAVQHLLLTGGTERWRLRTSTVLRPQLLLTTDWVRSRDNVDGLVDTTRVSNDGTASLTLSFAAGPILRAGYFFNQTQARGAAPSESTRQHVKLEVEHKFRLGGYQVSGRLGNTLSGPTIASLVPVTWEVELRSRLLQTPVALELIESRTSSSSTTNSSAPEHVARLSLQPGTRDGRWTGEVGLECKRQETPGQGIRSTDLQFAGKLNGKLTPRDTLSVNYRHLWRVREGENGSNTGVFSSSDQDYLLNLAWERRF